MLSDIGESMTEQTIEIDCPPGSPRPGDLIEGVIKGTGLSLRDSSSSFMGCWMWDYNDINPDVWKEIQIILEERLTKLYDNGTCRYCSW
jgi:hypothetical protein